MPGRPLKLRPCPKCGKRFGARKIREHIPNCGKGFEVLTFKRSVPDAQPYPQGDFEPPLALGPIARAEWNRIRADAPWIRAASAGVLAMRCVTFEDWVRIREAIVASPEPVHGLFQREREAKAYVMRADTELGLTACSVQKVGTTHAADPLDALEEAIG